MTDIPSALTGPSKGKITTLARQLWEQEGRPADRDVELWLRAEKQILAASETKPDLRKLTVAATPVPPPISTPKADGTAFRRTSAKPVKRAAG